MRASSVQVHSPRVWPTGMVRIIGVLALTLLFGVVAVPSAQAAPRPDAVVHKVAPALTLVEYVHRTTAGGQSAQSRGFTDGVVISADGLVLVSGKIRFPTAGAALPEIEEIRLHFADGRLLHAQPVEFDNDLNLGVLRILDAPSGPLPHLTPVPDRGFRIGEGLQSVTLLGADYGREPAWVSLGVTAHLRTPQTLLVVGGASSSILGAPLLDRAGRMVGVLAQVPMSPWAGRQVAPELSMVVGVASSRFLDFIERARTKAATMPRGTTADEAELRRQAAKEAAEADAKAAWMGIEFQPLTRELREHLRLSEGGGVVLTRVIPGGPAARAGLQPLDVLTQLDGQRIAVTQESDTPVFARQIRALPPGQVVTVVRERAGGAAEPVALTLDRSPKPSLLAERARDERFDYGVREITADTLLSQRLPLDTRGVVVDTVTRAGWAGLAELPTGVILQRIDDVEVTDLASWRAAMDKVIAARPEKVLFFVRYRRQTRFYVAEPDWSEVP